MALPENGHSTSFGARAGAPGCWLGDTLCSPPLLLAPALWHPLSPPPVHTETRSTYTAKTHALSICLHRETRAPARWQRRLKTIPGKETREELGLSLEVSSPGCPATRLSAPCGEAGTESYALPPWGTEQGSLHFSCHLGHLARALAQRGSPGSPQRTSQQAAVLSLRVLSVALSRHLAGP